MRITALIENTAARNGITAEHGLSLLIEANGRRVLFDAGQTDSLLGNAAALAIDDRPVGIDIENYDHYSEDVARTVMSDEEMRDILSSPRPAVAFTRLWTMKESLFKLTGDDHGGDIAHMLEDTSAFEFTTFDYPDYLLTTCQHKPGAGATIVKKVIEVIENCR